MSAVADEMPGALRTECIVGSQLSARTIVLEGHGESDAAMPNTWKGGPVQLVLGSAGNGGGA